MLHHCVHCRLHHNCEFPQHMQQPSHCYRANVQLADVDFKIAVHRSVVGCVGKEICGLKKSPGEFCDRSKALKRGRGASFAVSAAFVAHGGNGQRCLVFCFDSFTG